MTLFENDAYLSDEMTNLEATVYAQHKEWFDLAYKLNTYSRKLATSYKVHSENEQEVMSVALFIKVLNTYQALVILCRKGMPHEADILLRTMFESTVILKRLCDDKEFTSLYAQSDLLHRKKLLKGAMKNPHPMFRSARQLIEQGELAKVEEEIKRLGVTDEHIRSRAGKVGMSEFYDSVYRIACDVCHAGPRSLEDYFETDAKGKIIKFTSGPFIEIGLGLSTAMCFIMLAMESLNMLFHVSHQDEFEKISDRFVELKRPFQK